MGRYLVDEDLPRSLAPRLRRDGHDTEDVRDVGLRGRPDDAVLRYATSARRAVLTGDVGFGNLVRFPLGSHAGIVVARFPNHTPVSTLDEAIAAALRDLSDDDLSGNLAIIEAGRTRLRRAR
jgi:predicted nuclease of predicted toxin-antitoxin system